MTTEIQSFLPPYASNFSGRQDEFLPVLSEAEISRIERFGEHQKPPRRATVRGGRASGRHFRGTEKNVDDESARWIWSRSACRAPRSGTIHWRDRSTLRRLRVSRCGCR